MKKTLVTTTINVPNGLIDWSSYVDEMLVIGDRKSPDREIADLLNEITVSRNVSTTYFTSYEQDKWSVSDTIGWNCIQRRNIGLLEAYSSDADLVITVDDDNFPTHEWSRLEHVFNGEKCDLNADVSLISIDNSWYNVGEVCVPPVVHRGFPRRFRDDTTSSIFEKFVSADEEDIDAYSHISNYPIGVFAALWLGDPDVDASFRLTHGNKQVHSFTRDGVILDHDTWCPFNSQSTVIRRELIPLYFLFPHVGRYDDIWASYVMKAWMSQNGWHVRYGSPYVVQERNVHDIFVDFDNERLGMRHTDDFVDGLRNLQLANMSPLAAMSGPLFSYVSSKEYIPLATKHAMFAWTNDCMRIEHANA